MRRNEWITALAFGGRRNRVYRELVRISGAAPAERVLDVGCGRGYLARRLSAAVGPTGRVMGVDPSARAVELAAQSAPANCRFIVGTAQDLDFEDRSFDLVVSTLAVHHIPPAERARAFAEFRRVLRPGGRLLVADFGPARTHAFSRHGAHGEGGLREQVQAAGFGLVAESDVRRLSCVTATRT